MLIQNKHPPVYIRHSYSQITPRALFRLALGFASYPHFRFNLVRFSSVAPFHCSTSEALFLFSWCIPVEISLLIDLYLEACVCLTRMLYLSFHTTQIEHLM